MMNEIGQHAEPVRTPAFWECFALKPLMYTRTTASLLMFPIQLSCCLLLQVSKREKTVREPWQLALEGRRGRAIGFFGLSFFLE